jgi:hypothetical protein
VENLVTRQTVELPIVEKLMREIELGDFAGELANPDGPEAAALIMEAVEALTEIRRFGIDDHWGTPKVCGQIIDRAGAALTKLTGEKQ